MKETTDLQKLQAILDSYKVSNPHISFEDIVGLYLRLNDKDFNLLRLSSFLFNLDGQYLQKKIYNAFNNMYFAREKAYYIETYLKGEMYTDEKTAIEHLPLQIKHAEEIVKRLKND